MKNYNPRIIPVVLHKDGRIVKSRNFNFFQSVGDPVSLVKRYNSWNLDELIYLNISDNKSNFFYEAKNITTSSTASRKPQKSKENKRKITHVSSPQILPTLDKFSLSVVAPRNRHKVLVSEFASCLTSYLNGTTSRP